MVTIHGNKVVLTINTSNEFNTGQQPLKYRNSKMARRAIEIAAIISEIKGNSFLGTSEQEPHLPPFVFKCFVPFVSFSIFTPNAHKSRVGLFRRLFYFPPPQGQMVDKPNFLTIQAIKMGPYCIAEHR